MSAGKPCCSPSRENGAQNTAPDLPRSPHAGSTESMVRIEPECFLMGAEGPETWAADGEGPVREVRLQAPCAEAFGARWAVVSESGGRYAG